MAVRSFNVKSAIVKPKKDLKNTYVSAETIIILVIFAISGWYYHTQLFGTSIYVPVQKGVYIGGSLAFAIYIAVTILLSCLAFKLSTERKGILIESGIGYGAFVIAALLRTGIHSWSVRIIAAVIAFYLIYVAYRIRKKIKSIPVKVRGIKRHAIKKWVNHELWKYVSTGVFQAIGIIYAAMIVCSSFRFVNFNPDIEFNLLEMSEEKNMDYTVDEVWEEQMKIALYRENMDLIREFSDDVWSGHTKEEQLELLNRIAAVECEYYGLTPINVHLFDKKKDDGLVGYYNNGTRSIWVCKELLENDSYAVLSTLFHEVRHYYQHMLASKVDLEQVPEELRDLEMYRNIRGWKYEFADYISGDEDGCTYEQYHRQGCEQDSRMISRIAAQFYYDLANASTDEEVEELLQSGRVK